MKRTSEDRSALVSKAVSLLRRRFVPRIRRDFPAVEPCIMFLERGQERPAFPERAGELGAERAGEIAEIMGEFRREKSSRLPFDERKEITRIRGAIGRGGRFYGCAVGGELVSVVSVSQLVPKVHKFGMVFTRPEHRSKGLAASVVSRAVTDAFKKFGAEAVVLIADANDPAALRLYEKIGLKKTAPQRDLPSEGAGAIRVRRGRRGTR